MLRFGAYFGLLLGLASVINGLALLAYGQRALTVGRPSRIPAFRALFDVLADSAGARFGALVEGSAWLALGLLLTVLCADIIRPFLPRRRERRSDLPLRDPVAESFVSLSSRLAGLKGWALAAAVAMGVAALSLLLLNGG